MNFPDVFVLGRREVCGTHLPKELSQSVRMGHVAAMTTEPLETGNLAHPK